MLCPELVGKKNVLLHQSHKANYERNIIAEVHMSDVSKCTLPQSTSVTRDLVNEFFCINKCYVIITSANSCNQFPPNF